MRLVLLHPDLGLGGAERLVVDIAMAAVSKGHSVSMWTSHYEPERAFAETRTGAFDIQVHGDWIPRQLFGALHILFALARNTWLAVAAAFLAGPVDVFICDQVSICVPILRMLRPDARVLFYCHHPDLLLTSRKSILKRLYRLPFDVLEELTTLLSDRIVVNSKYTARVFQETFSLARATNVKPDVLYPCITLPALRGAASFVPPPEAPVVFLSINRYERKKGIDVAVREFAHLRATARAAFMRSKLVIAGGYDPRLAENVEYHKELCALADELDLPWSDVEAMGERPGTGCIEFVRNFDDEAKARMLHEAWAVVYTPENEHFGIVPIEAMASARPVLALPNGGPLETVVDRKTGFLVPSKRGGFAAAMRKFAEPESGYELVEKMGRDARNHVRDHFTRGAMADELDKHVEALTGAGANAQRSWVVDIGLWVTVVGTLLVTGLAGVAGLVVATRGDEL